MHDPRAELRAPFEAARRRPAWCTVCLKTAFCFTMGILSSPPASPCITWEEHTQGLQVVRVPTARGPVVLASDAAHFYANFEQGRPFPIVESVSDYLEAYRKIRRLAASDAHVIPGHDPAVLARYPTAGADIVRVDLPPEG